jgi:DNA-binding transcriptional MocR family regulator
MSELTNDPYIDLYADRMTGMTASEVRALFAVASRPDVVSLAGGMPFVSALPGEDVMDVVSSVLRDHGSSALQYCGGIGLPGIRERLVALMAEEGVEATPDRVVVTNGAQQALDLIGKIFIDPGDEIAVEEPSYVGAISAFSAYEPRFLQFPLDDDGLVVSALEEALVAGARPKFVYTIPNFSNPAGVTMSLARRERLVEVCRRFGVPLVEDNPYGMLRFEGQPVPSLRSLDPGNVIYLGTLSKVFAPGIRVGWAFAEHGTLDRLVLAKEAADLCSSAFTQLVAERYLEGDRWKANLRTLVSVYRSRRDAMLDALSNEFPADAHWTVPNGGFYVWATTPGVDTPTLLPEAVERKVAYVPGTAFYPDGRGRDRMRLSFCYPPEASIREGIRRLGALLADRASLRPAVTA